MAFAVVEPELICCPIIVANIKVGESIPVHVMEHRAQPPIQRRAGEGFAFSVEKRSIGPTCGFEMALSGIDEKHIRLAVLHDLSIRDHKPIGRARWNDWFSIHPAELVLPS